jgi:hypothetical protein
MSASSGKSAPMLSTKSYGALSVPQGGGSAFWRARSIGALVVIGAVVGWDRAISVPASTGQQAKISPGSFGLFQRYQSKLEINVLNFDIRPAPTSGHSNVSQHNTNRVSDYSNRILKICQRRPGPELANERRVTRQFC